MARRKRRPLVPESRAALDQLKNQVMANQGYRVDSENPDGVKYEIAEEAGVPLKPGYNGRLTSKQAGTVGGKIGGSMVKGAYSDGTGTDEGKVGNCELWEINLEIGETSTKFEEKILHIGETTLQFEEKTH